MPCTLVNEVDAEGFGGGGRISAAEPMMGASGFMLVQDDDDKS
jgi:hypothetical protein